MMSVTEHLDSLKAKHLDLEHLIEQEEARPRKHHRALEFELLGYLGEFVDQGNAASRHRQPAGGGETLQPASQIG